jgi:hypothetical protein
VPVAPAAGVPRLPAAAPVAPTPPPATDVRRYGITDLEALAAQQGWRELVEHLGDIAPAERDERWQRLAERAATGHLETLARVNDRLGALAAAEGLPQRFPTLRRSAAFMQKRAEVGLAGFEACYATSQGGADCTGRLLGFVDDDADNAELMLRAGRLVIRRQFAYVAAPFFRRALRDRAGPACEDRELGRAAAEALKLPKNDPLHADGAAIAKACNLD